MSPGIKTTSIVWGAWAIGMAASAAATLQRFERQGMGAVTAAQGLRALSHIVASTSKELVRLALQKLHFYCLVKLIVQTPSPQMNSFLMAVHAATISATKVQSSQRLLKQVDVVLKSC